MALAGQPSTHSSIFFHVGEADGGLAGGGGQGLHQLRHGVAHLAPVPRRVLRHHRVVEHLVGPGHAHGGALLSARGLVAVVDENALFGKGSLGEGLLLGEAPHLVAEGGARGEVIAERGPGKRHEQQGVECLLQEEVRDPAAACRSAPAAQTAAAATTLEIRRELLLPCPVIRPIIVIEH